MNFGRGILLALIAIGPGTAHAQTAPNQGGPMGQWARMVEVNLSAPVVTGSRSFRVFVKYTPGTESEIGVGIIESDAFLSGGGTCIIRSRNSVRGIYYHDNGIYFSNLTFGDNAKPIIGSIDFSCDDEVSTDQQVSIQLNSAIGITEQRQGEARHVFNQLQLVSQSSSR
jgi:hypothetical protein